MRSPYSIIISFTFIPQCHNILFVISFSGNTRRAWSGGSRIPGSKENKFTIINTNNKTSDVRGKIGY